MVRRSSGCKDAFELLLFPRVPLRYALPGRSWRLVPAGGRGRPPYGRTMAFGVPVGADALIGPLQKPHQPPGQRQRKAAQDVSQTSPGWRFPQGQRVSVPDCRKGLPTIPRRRQEVCASADRPAEAFFSLWTVHGPFLFWQDQKRNGGCICPAISMAVIPRPMGRTPPSAGKIFSDPCNESPASRTYLTERRENPHGGYGTDLPGPCQDRL